MKEIFLDKIHHFISQEPPDLLLTDGSAGRIARERSCGRIGIFSQSTSSTIVLHAHKSPGR
jgi:hypothetical protein